MRFSKLFIWLITIAAFEAVACEPDDISTRYLAAIQNQDWKTMATMLSRQARYYDPTMTHFDRPAIDLTGPDAITAFWRRSSEESGTDDIRYDVTHCFVAGELRVVHLDLEVDLAGKFWNVNRPSITVTGSLVSVFTVKHNLITEHIDYVDYAGGERLTDRLRQRYGPAKPD